MSILVLYHCLFWSWFLVFKVVVLCLGSGFVWEWVGGWKLGGG